MTLAPLQMQQRNVELFQTELSTSGPWWVSIGRMKLGTDLEGVPMPGEQVGILSSIQTHLLAFTAAL